MRPTRSTITAGTVAALALAAVVVRPAAAHDGPTIDDLAFLAGTWLADHDGDRLEEHYMAPVDGIILGMFRWSSDGATGLTEHIVIEQQDDAVRMLLRHFNPGSTPWASEADAPTTLTLDSVEGGRAVFASDRAFPSRLVYHRVAPDQLIARLEGHRESGEPRELEFHFRSTSMTTSTETLTQAGQSIGYDGGLTIAVKCSDISKSIDWYQNVLGFKLLYHLEDMGWCELTTGVNKVAIGLSQVESLTPGGPTPTFGVKDIEHARSRLEDQGVRFDGPTIEIPNMVKLATFFDPDGNTLMFYQSLSSDMP